MLENYSRHQQGIIKRYYRNFDAIQLEKLAELVAELYLAEGKKLDRLWKSTAELLTKLEIPATRIEHITAKRDPVLVANIVKEISSDPPK